MTLNWRRKHLAQGQSRNSSSSLEYTDITHAYLWDVSDYEYIKKIYATIKLLDKFHEFEEKRAEISRFERILNRAQNDQTAYDELHARRVEPMEILEKKDRITNSGRTRAAELIAGEAGNRFDFAAIGTSQLPVSDSDSGLFAEVNRINIRLSGYASASGAIIKHSALWTPGLQSATFWEFAPVDRAVFNVLQMIWARVVFPPTKGLVHIQNVDFFTVTHSTYTSSLA
jgi:hypothetical protein